MSWHVFFLFVGFFNGMHHHVFFQPRNVRRKSKKICGEKLITASNTPGSTERIVALLRKRRSVWTRVPLDFFIIAVLKDALKKSWLMVPFLTKKLGVFWGDFFDEVFKELHFCKLTATIWVSNTHMFIFHPIPNFMKWCKMLRDRIPL